MADEVAEDIDYDMDPADIPKAEVKAEAKPEPKAEVKAPKHKSFFLRAAAKVGIDADEANEMEPDELERAIRLATPSPVSVASPAPPQAQKPAEDGDEDADDFADLEGYDEVFLKRFKKLHEKVKEFKAATKTLKAIEEREQKREQLEYARKIDKVFIKANIPVLGDKPFDEYENGSPEMEARNQVLAAANAARKADETFETALKRTLKLFQLVKAEPKAAAVEDPEPAVSKKLEERRKERDENGGVSKPVYRKEEPPGGRRAALHGIASVLSRETK